MKDASESPAAAPGALALDAAQRKALRADAHHLKPVVMVGDAGLTPSVLAETDRALTAHGLIKVRVQGDDRDARAQALQSLCETLGCAPVQTIGKVLVLWRPVDDGSARDDRGPHVPKKLAALASTEARPSGRTAAGKARTAAKAKAPERAPDAKTGNKSGNKSRLGAGSRSTAPRSAARSTSNAAAGGRTSSSRAPGGAGGRSVLSGDGGWNKILSKPRKPSPSPARGASRGDTPASPGPRAARPPSSLAGTSRLRPAGTPATPPVTRPAPPTRARPSGTRSAPDGSPPTPRTRSAARPASPAPVKAPAPAPAAPRVSRLKPVSDASDKPVRPGNAPKLDGRDQRGPRRIKRT